jgi:circadian clock protein KaiB
MATSKSNLAAFEKASARSKAPKYVLQLYVAGATPMSVRALANLREICEEHLRGRYHLEVVDVYEEPGLAKADDVIAIPTLLKKLPAPVCRLIGDLSDRQHVLVGLSLRSKHP